METNAVGSLSPILCNNTFMEANIKEYKEKNNVSFKN